MVALGSLIYVAILPLALGAAILRYRLYDLDRIISRALAYGLLTVLLGGGYAVVVLGLGQLLGRDSAWPSPGPHWPWPPCSSQPAGGSSRPSTGASTGAATTTIEAFSGRLRDQVEIETVSGEVLEIVRQTLQPVHATIWLKPPEAER